MENNKTDRFYVDVRTGCAAIRDREHTDPEYQGLHITTVGVVEYIHGKWIQESGEWQLNIHKLEELHKTCELMNERYEYANQVPAAAD